jgi:alkylation response protein AidB-like acyl-CoA dehydrogenase
VTGGAHAHTIVTGATLEDGRQVLLAAPTATKGVKAAEPLRLVGVSASDTGPVHFERALFERKHLLAGPIHDVMSQGIGARTGGLETSTLAIGLSDAAIAFLETEAGKRDDLAPAAASLRKEHTAMETDLLAMATGAPSCSTEQLRQRANSLVLRAAQAALTAAKGAGYVLGHPAGRWCREALFFLVWSCPQPVAAAHLCELAGLGD